MTNRYGDVFTFTPQEDGTYYGKAILNIVDLDVQMIILKLQYTRDTGGGISLEQFN
jgi:hypothetical protein